MSLARIRDEFHVPARLGQRVECGNRDKIPGAIVGSAGDFIVVQFDNTVARGYFHPEEVEYTRGTN